MRHRRANSTSADGRASQAQFALYATEIMLRQHRTHVFMVYIHRNMARLTRWDRAGCIVTTPFNFKANPEMLLNFVYRIVQMSDAERGYDTTAKLATADEIAMLEAFKPKNVYAKERVKTILDAQLYYPIYKVCCLHISCALARSALTVAPHEDNLSCGWRR